MRQAGIPPDGEGRPDEAAPDSVGDARESTPSGATVDLSRLRLDTLLHELIDRAEQVIGNEQRVHRLLDAVISVASNLALPQVLQRITRSSADLVGAKYAALGVIGPDRSLTEFRTVGIGKEQRDSIGHLPTGKGILGLLIDEPTPIRMHDLSQHPYSSGFPPNHPPMRSFLGVPIRVRGEAFGNLYLTEKADGSDFTEADQEVVVALAAAAGIAIENARLYEETQRRESWLIASTEITSRLLEGATITDTLDLIAARAMTVSNAEVAALALVRDDEPGEFILDTVSGPRSSELNGLVIPVEGTPIGDVLRTGQPQVHNSGSADRSWLGPNAATEELKHASVVLVPLVAGQHMIGVLLVARPEQSVPFDSADMRMVMTFASHAALALEFARAQEDRQRLAVFEDRDRIARDLHDQVIQRLFAVGLGLQGATRLMVRPEVAERVRGYVSDLDITIQEIRRAIFSLHAEPAGVGNSVRAEVLQVVHESLAGLGFEPRVTLEGPIDSVVGDDLRPDLLATLREAIMNIARHAAATRAEIRIHADTDSRALTLQVIDNGRGVPTHIERRGGLNNVATRAERRGGSCTIEPESPTGTRLTWTAPLSL